jgi:hypothetical protein
LQVFPQAEPATRTPAAIPLKTAMLSANYPYLFAAQNLLGAIFRPPLAGPGFFLAQKPSIKAAIFAGTQKKHSQDSILRHLGTILAYTFSKAPS